MRKLYVSKWNDHLICAVTEDSETIEFIVCGTCNEEKIGDIYIGVVSKYLPKLHAYFIELSDNKEGFLQASEVTRALSIGEKVIVQVTRLGDQYKSCKLTMMLTFPGRYLVYSPNAGYVAASKRLVQAERETWITYGNELVKNNEGVIFRTAVATSSKTSVKQEFAQLRLQAEAILRKKVSSDAPLRLYNGFNCIEQTLHNYPDMNEVFTNCEELYNKLEKMLFSSNHLQVDDVTLEKKTLLNLDKEINRALKKVVWLPNASNLLIEETEIATIIDVNSGKSRDSIVAINLKAAQEIARQLRLRNVGGMIVIDFIRMERVQEREMVANELKRAIRSDKKTVTLFGFTKMGLFELTRKKLGASLQQSLRESEI